MWWLQGTLQYSDNNITMMGINKALMSFSCALPSTPDWSIVGSFGLERCDNMTPCPLISIQIPPGDDVRCWSKSHRRCWPLEFNPETPGAPSRKTHPKRLTLSLSQNREEVLWMKCVCLDPTKQREYSTSADVGTLRRCWCNIVWVVKPEKKHEIIAPIKSNFLLLFYKRNLRDRIPFVYDSFGVESKVNKTCLKITSK